MASVALPSTPATDIDPEMWAEATCRDLLSVQAQNRRLPSDERAEVVEQHLRKCLAAVADPQRRGCLRALAARFPLPETHLAPAGMVAGPVTPAEWVASFDVVRDGLTPELKHALLEKLEAAGCLPPSPTTGRGGIPVPAALEPLLPKDSVDPVRVAQLLDVIFEASRVLDGNFRRVWEGVAEFGKTDHGLPRSSFDEVMRKFLLGDQDVPRVMLKSRIETITKLIPIVLISVKESWDAMEVDVGNCLPEEIQKRVRKGAFGYEAGCWKEFTKAAEKLQPDARVQEFFEQIVTKARSHIPRH